VTACGFDLAQINGSTVAQLACPVAKLMPTVTGGVWVHARQQLIAGKHLEKCFAGTGCSVETQ
jgi:hypothetical protein